MSKKLYRLSVPVPAEGESVPEFVSHGNLEATLEPGKIVETDNEHFARHLELSYGLELKETVEVEGEPIEETTPAANETDPAAIDAGAYPEDFPGRDALIEQNVAFETLRGLDPVQLTAYKGIGPKTAEAIIEFFDFSGGVE